MLRCHWMEEFPFATSIICSVRPPPTVRSHPQGLCLWLFAPVSPSCSLSTILGTIKQSLFPLRVKLPVPKLKGNGLILLNML